MSDKVPFPDKEGISSSLDIATGLVELSKWNKEAWMRFGSSSTLVGSGKIGDKYKLTYGEYAVQVYELPNGLEYEIVIGKIPSSNVFIIPIISENLKFYYQAPLDDKKYTYPAGSVISATHVYDANGNLITERSIKVVGSYAVYHSSKRNNAYKAGKAFHIYRPLVTDKEGNTIWGVLKYDNSNLTVTVEQAWLDKANYPVVIDPTIGYETAGGSWYTAVDKAPGSKFASAAGTATMMSAYLKNTDASSAHNAQAAIYSFTDIVAPYVEPLVVSSGSVSIPKSDTGHWFDFDIADTIVDGTDTILLVSGEDSGLPFYYGIFLAYDDLDLEHGWEIYPFTFGTWNNPETIATYDQDITASIHYDYTAAPSAAGGLMMVPSLKGHMGYDLKTRGGKARRRIF